MVGFRGSSLTSSIFLYLDLSLLLKSFEFCCSSTFVNCKSDWDFLSAWFGNTEKLDSKGSGAVLGVGSEMGLSQNDGRMEGWLFLIRSNRIGLQYSTKRYFVLEDQNLKSYKSIPTSENEVRSILYLPVIVLAMIYLNCFAIGRYLSSMGYSL